MLVVCLGFGVEQLGRVVVRELRSFLSSMVWHYRRVLVVECGTLYRALRSVLGTTSGYLLYAVMCKC